MTPSIDDLLSSCARRMLLTKALYLAGPPDTEIDGMHQALEPTKELGSVLSHDGYDL